ncbi:Hypothetical Protein FCC1311_052302 [Hondaea fermentalgiana]|uniref:Uncharacterized protein n=1 Tax=Hondaea fermentalgiana TaxID=2315210 RepID=A0A2R5GGX4_9STRA|nr:Hypothetical Protein FCC1311_052302 [Hondaea fermentalgiana]|eukprot:GBG29008.1 Hypothetical Protein FCC1311_052302 [Hondaea fermentalgiana]
MEAGRRLLRREGGRKDSTSSLQEIWADLPESPAHEKSGSGSSVGTEPNNSAGKSSRHKGRKISSVAIPACPGAPGTPRGLVSRSSSTTTSAASSDSGSCAHSSNQRQDSEEQKQSERRRPRRGGNYDDDDEEEEADRDDNEGEEDDDDDGIVLDAVGGTVRLSAGIVDDEPLSPPPMPPRPRKGSDSSLLGAKKLIESALDQKSRTERRLSAQLERLEAQIRKSFGSVGGGSRRRSAGSARTRRALGSPEEAENAHFWAPEGKAGRVRKSAAAHPLQQQQRLGCDSGGDLGDDDELCRQTDDEGEVTSSDGDETLVSSLEDAYDDPDNVQVLQQAHATLVEEHQGLQDEIARMNGQLAWIESQLQATKGHAQCLSRSTSDWAGMMRQIAHSTAVQEQLRVIQQGSMVIKHSAKKRGCGPRFLVFDMDEGQLLWSKSMTGASEICRQINQRDRDNLERNANPFAVAYTETSSASQVQVGVGANISCFPLASVAAVLHGEEEITLMVSQDDAFVPGGAHRVTANIEAVCRDRGNLIVAVLTVDGVPLIFEFFNADLAATFALGLRFIGGSEAIMALAAVQNGVRSLNASFELRSLEEVGGANRHHQRGRASQLQKDLAATQSREAYQEVLIGASNAKSQLVLPLKSNRDSRNSLADQTQVLKDLSRERAILLNAAYYELGSVEQTTKFARKLRDLLSDTIRQLSTDELAVPEDSHVEFWTRELLLASSRTVIEGDVYSVCHRMLTGPPEVLLCPSTTHVASPIEIFVAPDGLITIESATAYRVVRVCSDGDAASPEVWVQVHARCIEHLYLTSPFDLNEETDERNIRSLRLEFEAEQLSDDDTDTSMAPETN